MIVRLLAFAAAAIGLTPPSQPPAAIDFQRDVQPIFREHCVGCHGPTQQFGGLRLDRRADALRGGTQTDIGPGNANGSRLYHRLIGTTFGTQMPPTGPLSADKIEIIQHWIDEGAIWPDAAAGEAPPLPSDPDAVRLLASIRGDDRHAVDEQLRANPRVVTLRGSGGTTPLMAAALYGDAAIVKRLLAAGAEPNAENAAGMTALMLALPDVGKMQPLLDAGADVNVRSQDRRSALVIAAGIVGAEPAVKLLLEYGADPSPWRSNDPQPLREAARCGDAATFRLLLPYVGGPKSAAVPPVTLMRTYCFGCAELVGAGEEGPLTVGPPIFSAESTAPRYDPGRAARPTPIGETPADQQSLRAAVQRSLPLLQDIGPTFINQTGCVSCHHNSVVSMAVAAARTHGFAVNETTAKAQTSAIGKYLESWRDRAVQNIPIAGQADTMSYLLFGLASDGYAPDPATDAQAIFLKRRQAADGHWALNTVRPPIESNEIEVTAVSMRALQVFAPPSQRAAYAEATDRARAWLTTARGDLTEERAFRLLGLHWAKAPAGAVETAAHELLALQKDDGGWSQTQAMASDAYATGEALVALRESAAVPSNSRAYRKGLEFLLRTQIEDGSWIVETRSVPIQAYFESGFPYGVNQWISAAATGWATTALALATEVPQTIPRPPAPPPGPPRPEDGSAAPDGYSPIPMWLGQTRAPHSPATAAFSIETVAEGLSGAFCFDFLPDGRIIVGERPGRIRIVGKDGKLSAPLEGMPADLWAHGQGLFEVRPDRAFASNRRIFLTYTVLPEGSNQAALPRSPGVLMVASATLSSDEKKLENLKTLLNAEGTGGRLIQAPDGTLLITSTIPSGVGINAVDWPQPQQLTSNMGKVLRINADGSIPKDNPFAGRGDAHPEIYALGIRDAQGVAIHPRTGLLWLSEHGPRGGDEINAIARGKNYGFPVIGYGREYSGKPINGDKTAQDGMEQPVYFWTPDIAPAGIAFYTGSLFPGWRGDLFVSALAGKALVRLVLKDDKVIAEERLLTELGARIRGVNQGPDGALYVLTDGNAGKIIKLVPKR
ncbi:MAG TPA: PQQ-dependent sugar dehydrogenase [Vicinamibacterales bacterium]|nr:PQQ-dependent sugar dehydrogenase [Vicinamibacterales bacterium]